MTQPLEPLEVAFKFNRKILLFGGDGLGGRD